MPLILGWIGVLLSGELNFVNSSKKDIKASMTAPVYDTATGFNLVNYDLPRVSLSMSSSTGGNGTMKLDVSLEVPKGQVGRVADFEPRIIEKILLFMRQQSFEQFQQPNGARELRKSLEHEIRNGAFPIQIARVDVREMVFE